jgi:hypothetical protein
MPFGFHFSLFAISPRHFTLLPAITPLFFADDFAISRRYAMLMPPIFDAFTPIIIAALFLRRHYDTPLFRHTPFHTLIFHCQLL